MIKGVNKRIVEINNTDNEYFDKAILFVSSDVGEIPPAKLSEYAGNYLDKIGKKRSRGYGTFLVAAVSAVSTLFLTAICVVILL